MYPIQKLYFTFLFLLPIIAFQMLRSCVNDYPFLLPFQCTQTESCKYLVFMALYH